MRTTASPIAISTVPEAASGGCGEQGAGALLALGGRPRRAAITTGANAGVSSPLPDSRVCRPVLRCRGAGKSSVRSWPRVGAFIEQRMGRSTPCEELLGAQPVAPSHLRHGRARLQALLHDAGLVVTRPSAAPPGARDQLDPPHVRDAVAGLIAVACKLTLKLMVKMIAHGLALRHHPSPDEMWGRRPAYPSSHCRSAYCQGTCRPSPREPEPCRLWTPLNMPFTLDRRSSWMNLQVRLAWQVEFPPEDWSQKRLHSQFGGARCSPAPALRI